MKVAGRENAVTTVIAFMATLSRPAHADTLCASHVVELGSDGGELDK